MKTIANTHFNFPDQKAFYRGKVRDNYIFGDTIIMITTDRISAFDVILPKAIPFKGEILTAIAAYFLRTTSDIAPNWLLAQPDPNALAGLSCTPFPVEIIVRGYLAGHAWRLYQKGIREVCGVPLPEGLKENDPLPSPIITPSTKSQHGHDEDISKEEIIKQGLISESKYKIIENYAHQLYQHGQKFARSRGLILADTKYEFGYRDDTIYLIDEVHTPDSSRYFYLDEYEYRQKQGLTQKHLSKEFVRQWLISKGFQGLDGQHLPEMLPKDVEMISERYIELYENLIGEKFIKENHAYIDKRIEKNILNYLQP